MHSSIMVVEDEIVVAMEIEEKLRAIGYDVVSICSNGEEAISGIEERRPDLVLMDIRLDGRLDGIETAELIRKRHDLPVVYLTAYADDATLNRAKLTEPFGYLVKPFSPNRPADHHRSSALQARARLEDQGKRTLVCLGRQRSRRGVNRDRQGRHCQTSQPRG